MKPETKYKGSIKLSAIGDALGWITEFEKSPQSLKEKFGTEKIDLQTIVDAVKNNFDLSPKWIIEKLDLRKPIFRNTAAYGHFGRDEFSWEKLDSVDVFKKLL